MKGEGKEQPQPEGQGAAPLAVLNRGTEEQSRRTLPKPPMSLAACALGPFSTQYRSSYGVSSENSAKSMEIPAIFTGSPPPSSSENRETERSESGHRLVSVPLLRDLQQNTISWNHMGASVLRTVCERKLQLPMDRMAKGWAEPEQAVSSKPLASNRAT
jgi:hypothetical protein